MSFPHTISRGDELHSGCEMKDGVLRRMVWYLLASHFLCPIVGWADEKRTVDSAGVEPVSMETPVATSQAVAVQRGVVGEITSLESVGTVQRASMPVPTAGPAPVPARVAPIDGTTSPQPVPVAVGTGVTPTRRGRKPLIVDHFACSDFCPGPREQYMVKVYDGVTDPEACRALGGMPQTYTGWGTFRICVAEGHAIPSKAQGQ